MSAEGRAPLNWKRIDWFLMTERGFKPWELDLLTIPEIVLLCEAKADDITDGTVLHGESDLFAYAAWWAALSPVGKLRAGRAQLGA